MPPLHTRSALAQARVNAQRGWPYGHRHPLKGRCEVTRRLALLELQNDLLEQEIEEAKTNAPDDFALDNRLNDIETRLDSLED